jgi:hypothetical protein
LVASTLEKLLTVTTPVAVTTYTPSGAGLWRVAIYYRVVTATTTVTITVSYTDVGGAQVLTILGATGKTVGSYALADTAVYCAAGSPITVNVTAATANQVYVSADILQD